MRLLRFAAALLLAAAGLRAAPPSPERVVVLANADDPDSLEVARHYLKARAIPVKNLVALPLPKAEEIDWATFVGRVRNPLLEKLAAEGFITGERAPVPDAEGRIRFSTSSNRVDFLVLCRGVPLRIANDPVRLEAREPEAKARPPFAVNVASVDSELAVLPRPDTPLFGFVPNPWYEKADPAEKDTRDLLRVARLDGPSADDAKRLVDNALTAEHDGLLGRAYIDEGGPHPQGDLWLEGAADLCRRACFDTTVEKTPALIGADARFDAPAFYFGWYAPSITGASARPGATFPPGAVAIHIHSFSALTLRDPAAGWTGPLVARGVTATVGNVAEPYLQLTHNPVLFLHRLMLGKTAGEAAAFSSPALSWQTIFVGDPLYRPFTHDVGAQLKDIAVKRDPALAYAALRGVRKIDSEKNRAHADAYASESLRALPVLALAHEKLVRDIAASRPVSFSVGKLAPISEDPGLVADTADLLAKHGAKDAAVELLTAQLALGVALPARCAATAKRCGRIDLAEKIAPTPQASPPK